MGKKKRSGKIGYRAAALFLAACTVFLAVGGQDEGQGLISLAKQEALSAAASFWSPSFSYASNTRPQGFWQKICGHFPFLSLYGGQKEARLQQESGWTYEDIIRAEGQDEGTDSLQASDMVTPEKSEGRVTVEAELEELLRQENEKAGGQEKKQEGLSEGQDGAAGGFPVLAATGKKQDYEWAYFRRFDALLKEFYAVDASTAVDESQLNLDALLGRDLSIEKRRDEEPQILIYHTHSQEDFANSVQGDPATTIMGVGEVLTQLLRDGYGYNVMHHMGQYDVENRDYAYNNSLPELEKLLAQYPSIEVVIDLHRDEVAEGTKLVIDLDGRPTAMFMFFNGLSRTKKHGDIEYLPNENIADNLAFSFQMQALCNEYYPGLTRRIYLKGYRYNMHLKPRYLLVEMGAQTNTYEECYNACLPLARILDMELSGVDFGYTAE